MSSAFNESLFEKKLLQLRETHESISNLSTWCLANQSHHSKIISIWLGVLKRVKIEHRLLLFYLANDIIQYSRRKHLPFVEAFAPALQKATTMVREDSVKNKVLRLFKIWDDRGIYDEAFLLDLSGLLICDPKGGNRMDVQDFLPNVMYSRIRSCKKLEDDTDLKLKVLNESPLPLTDVDRLRKSLKDREHGEDVMEDVENALIKIKAYVDALEAEIKERAGLLDMLDTGEQYYDKDLKEAKIVVNAYKCFGQRVKQVQRKLDEKIETLPSPVPSPPDLNAPSPSPPLSPDLERQLSGQDLNPTNFTMGDSFINNTGLIEKALDSRNSHQPDFYSPSVYTPSMTTGSGLAPSRDNIPYTPSSVPMRDADKLPYTPTNRGESDPYTPRPVMPRDSSLYRPSSPLGMTRDRMPFTTPPSALARDNMPYTPSLNASSYDNVAETSYSSRYSSSENIFNTSLNDDRDYGDSNARISQYNSDSQLSNESYPAEYFIGANSSDATSYPAEVREDNLESSVFSGLMDSKGGLLPPPPPPPPPPDPSTEENKIEVIGGSIKQPSLAEILKSLIGKKEDDDQDDGSVLKPPPQPPSGLQDDGTWQAPDWDSPLSPPPFQDFPAADTDMRPKDIDHRNLISLTGWDSKASDDLCEDKDDRPPRSGLYDSDSSDSRSPPDHIPRLNLGPSPMETVSQSHVPGVPSIRPPRIINLPPVNLPPPCNLSVPPPSLPPIPTLPPPPEFKLNGLMMRPLQDNMENIDMEMSDEEEKKELSPVNRRDRPSGLVPLTPDDDTDVLLSLQNDDEEEEASSMHTTIISPGNKPHFSMSLPPPPSPNLSLLDPFQRPPPPLATLRPHRMPTDRPPWLPPGLPQRPPMMYQQPRPPFFNPNASPRGGFRPRPFRPRFQPRW